MEKPASGNGSVTNSAFGKAENNTDAEHIAEIIKDKAQALTSGDRDKVLKSLADGHITKENLDVCLRRIEELSSNNAEL